jgi:hypothetical protein
MGGGGNRDARVAHVYVAPCLERLGGQFKHRESSSSLTTFEAPIEAIQYKDTFVKALLKDLACGLRSDTRLCQIDAGSNEGSVTSAATPRQTVVVPHAIPIIVNGG